MWHGRLLGLFAIRTNDKEKGAAAAGTAGSRNPRRQNDFSKKIFFDVNCRFNIEIIFKNCLKTLVLKSSFKVNLLLFSRHIFVKVTAFFQ